MQALLFTNARVFDGHSGDCADGMNVLVADRLIREVSAQPLSAPEARRIDIAGRTLMPWRVQITVQPASRTASVRRFTGPITARIGAGS